MGRVSGPRRCRDLTALATGLLRLLVLLVGVGSGGYTADGICPGHDLCSCPGGNRKVASTSICQRLSRRKKNLEFGVPDSVGPRRYARSGPGWNRISSSDYTGKLGPKILLLLHYKRCWIDSEKDNRFTSIADNNKLLIIGLTRKRVSKWPNF